MAAASERDWTAFLSERGASGTETASMPLHFGDPRAEYDAAREGTGLVPRGDRTLLRVHGRGPRQMLQGILTSSISDPPPAGAAGEGLRYGAVLTPKGRMVTDLKQGWLGTDEAAGIFLDVPRVALDGTEAMFRKSLPPRFARYESLHETVGLLTVAGPGARRALEGGFGPLADGLTLVDGGPLEGGAAVAPGIEQPPSWDVWAPWERLPALWDALASDGARPVGGGVWETLRIEGGHPRFGQDMDESTIPIEAGLGERAFDHAKGCYTGQEVIVRIRHRGRVNWHLRSLRFDGGGSVGDELFAEGGDKVLGRVTSVADSPRFGGRAGLGYVRREVELPGRLWSGDDRAVRVEVHPLPTDPDGSEGASSPASG